jgi:DUF971 family protein
MATEPVKLALDNSVLVIEWNDGLVQDYDPTQLRQYCPCATCSSQRKQAFGDEEEPLPADPNVTIEDMTPIGNYAYKISFSDGHDTGFFTLERLRHLGRMRT